MKKDLRREEAKTQPITWASQESQKWSWTKVWAIRDKRQVRVEEETKIYSLRSKAKNLNSLHYNQLKKAEE